MRIALFGLVLVGCGGGGPNSGTWQYEGVALSEDTCNAGDEISDPDGEFYIENNGDGTFTVDPNDGTDVFGCTLDGSDFNCADRLVETVVNNDFDVTIHVNGTAEGNASGTSGEGQQIGTVDCEGSGCGVAEGYFGTTFPCKVVWDFEITWVNAELGGELE